MKPAQSVSRVPLSHSFRFAPKLAMVALTAALLALTAARPARGEDQAVGEIETARNSFAGIVNANSVFVRSGPTDVAYSTMKLNKGDRVTVVGVKLDWLKIIPPEGSFCYIGKLYIDRHGDGTQGRINKDKVNVRAGSTLNSMTYAILCEAAEGANVTILGEHDEYYKIKPPEKAFLYVNKQYVDPDPNAKPQKIVPDRGVVAETHTTQPEVVPPVVGPGTVVEVVPPATNPSVSDTHGSPVADVTRPATPENATPTTHPAANVWVPPTHPEATGAEKIAIVPTTQPSPVETAAGAEALFAKAEADYSVAIERPLEQETIAPILASYQVLASADKLPDSLRRVAEARVSALTARASAAQKLAEVHKAQDEMRRRQVALQAEGKELEERLALGGVKIFTAVGELRPSSLQVGAQTLYRLTDPATGRTVCYVRTSEPKYVTFLGQFVGVKGDIGTDAQLNLKVLAPTAIEAVDAAKVNNGIAAQVIPPSLMPKPQAASIRQE